MSLENNLTSHTKREKRTHQKDYVCHFVRGERKRERGVLAITLVLARFSGY